MIIPFFKSHYSLNKSILTLSSSHDGDLGPKSILKLIKENNIKNAFLVDENMSGFPEMYYNSQELAVDINFGLRLTVCQNIKEKNEASIKSESKVIIFIKNAKGYECLSSIFSIAAKDGFYYLPRIDLQTLRQNWCDDLILGIPFYDSFLFKNHFNMSSCVPEAFWTKPVFFWENNNLPFDLFYKQILSEYLSENFPDAEFLQAQSIYYNDRDDFLAYLAMRCIGKKSELQKPKLDHLSSCDFCLESFLEKI
jgi:DNA polymerase III alpha subunit